MKVLSTILMLITSLTVQAQLYAPEIKVQNTNANRIGINMDDPQANLHVQGGVLLQNSPSRSTSNGQGASAVIPGALNVFKKAASSESVNTVLNLGNYYAGSGSGDKNALAIDFRKGDGSGVKGVVGRIKVQTAIEPVGRMDFDVDGYRVLRLRGQLNNNANYYNLDVNGSINATSYYHRGDLEWPDYVFEESYPLMDLTKVNQYIHTHQHLPDIPSREEVQKHGIELVEMNAKLLQKIEELTLYIIEQEERLSALEKKQTQLESRP